MSELREVEQPDHPVTAFIAGRSALAAIPVRWLQNRIRDRRRRKADAKAKDIHDRIMRAGQPEK